MTHLSKEAVSVIETFIDFIREDDADLTDTETIVDLLEGEFEENYPNIRISRSDIRSYLLNELLHPEENAE